MSSQPYAFRNCFESKNMMHRILLQSLFFSFVLISFVFVSGCGSEPPLFELLSPETTGIAFANTITDNDSLVNALSFDNVYNGGGVAIGDFNNDGLQDVFFAGNMVSNRLYLNRGKLAFTDVTEAAGLLNHAWSTGVALVDINGDGWLDIYVSVAGTDEADDMENMLYVNQGVDGQGIPSFVEVAKLYGVADPGFGVQAAFFDYDRDGDLDLYVLNNALDNSDKNSIRPRKLNGEAVSTDRLYRNNGDNTFTDVSGEAGVLVEGYGLGVAVQDINLDGWPDVYVSNDFLTNDIIYVNNQDGTFINRAGDYLKHQAHSAMGNDLADINNDGLVDIFVLDMLPRDRKREKLMLPPGNDDMFEAILAMGYEPQYMRNMLQLNNGFGPDGKLTFSEIGQFAGVHATDWSWSPLLADFDNDGYRDLLVTTGHRKDLTNLDFIVYGQRSLMMGTDESIRRRLLDTVRELPPIKTPNFIFRNNGDLTFSDKTSAWGFGLPSVSQGSAFADLDNDGDLDLVINNMDAPASIYRNHAVEGKGGHYLRIAFKGPSLNQEGLGARITLRYQGETQHHDHSRYRGFLSTVENVAHFGTGGAARIDSLEIQWPDGKYELLTDVPADQVLILSHDKAELPPPEARHIARPLFARVNAEQGLRFKHKEYRVNDFRQEPLLFRKLSQEGPGMAAGYEDGNGLDDFYVGGDRGSHGTLFLQNRPGQFVQQPMQGDTLFEDMGSLLFDVDADGDLDLYVVSGGNLPSPSPDDGRNGMSSEFSFISDQRSRAALPDSSLYQDRLYLNDGKGHFARDENALPDMMTSGSCVTAADFDGDGDLDLFVGGRLLPARYPLPPRSYLLRNDTRDGQPVRFTDVTEEIAPELARVGMVAGALWTDFDQDEDADLMLVGEWMPVTFFKNTNGRFTNVTLAASLPNTSGWWNSLSAGDFDNDGDMDYVAGNLGLNTKYKASEKEPVRIYASDYDQNGTLDPVLTHFVDGTEYAVYPRDVMIAQMPGMKLRFKTYQDYAAAAFDRTFTDRELEDAYRTESVLFETSYLENRGNGKFAIKSLPARAQFAPVYGLLVEDFNSDGNLDILAVGNSYAPDPQTGRYDASVGALFFGDGRGGFTYIDEKRSGFFVDGNARGIAQVAVDSNRVLFLVPQNNDSLEVFTRPEENAGTYIRAGSADRSVILDFGEGKQRRLELYYGSAYLSQSSRVIRVPEDVKRVIIRNYRGNERVLVF